MHGKEHENQRMKLREIIKCECQNKAKQSEKKTSTKFKFPE